MYAVQCSYRVFFSFLLLLCASFLFAPKVNAIYTWDDANTDLKILKREVDTAYREMVNRSRGVSVAQTGNIAGEVGSGNTLKASTPVRYGSTNLSANSSSVLNYGSDLVKRGAAACMKAPVRCNLVGAAVGVGINSLLDSIGGHIEDDKVIGSFNDLSDIGVGPNASDRNGINHDFLGPSSSYNFTSFSYQIGTPATPEPPSTYTLVRVWSNSSGDYINGRKVIYYEYCDAQRNGSPLVGYNKSQPRSSQCQFGTGGGSTPYAGPQYTLNDQQIDSLSDNFELTDSDLPTIGSEVMKNNQPTTIDLAPSEYRVISETTKFNEDGTSYVEETKAKFDVKNSPSSSPIVEYVQETTRTNYDSLGNQTGQSTSTATDTAVSNSSQPSVPTGQPTELEIPTGCALFDPFCQWAKWTQEPLDNEEPDLTTLISEFEPDEDAFDLGISDGSCPSPIQLNLTFIGKTVEVSYGPFCDFLNMIRPFVIAAAYLFAAYIYLGVLKRG